jgi:hypothetical protein
MQGKITSETAAHLEIVAKRSPNARTFLELQTELR